MLGTFFQDMESSDPRFNCCVHSLLRTLVARAIEIDDKPFFSLDKESITLNIFDELLEEMQVTTEHPLTVLLVAKRLCDKQWISLYIKKKLLRKSRQTRWKELPSNH